MRFKTAAATAFAVGATACIAPSALAHTQDAEHTINPTGVISIQHWTGIAADTNVMRRTLEDIFDV